MEFSSSPVHWRQCPQSKDLRVWGHRTVEFSPFVTCPRAGFYSFTPRLYFSEMRIGGSVQKYQWDRSRHVSNPELYLTTSNVFNLWKQFQDTKSTRRKLKKKQGHPRATITRDLHLSNIALQDATASQLFDRLNDQISSPHLFKAYLGHSVEGNCNPLSRTIEGLKTTLTDELDQLP
ncbi:hypothetical protein TNCV_1177621 [Trichonephila clavipes]|nr:hypothetical protein TNCV_1177621 [Trichonephila clavipes]